MTSSLHSIAEAQALAAGFQPLVLEARRVSAGVLQGAHTFRKSGAGEQFWQYRRYTTGDPAALIDWRKSARSRHLYVREHEEQLSAAALLWCDGSPSMVYRSEPGLPEKRERAVLLALALTELLARGGERVGVADGVRTFATGSRAITSVASRLSAGRAGALPEAVVASGTPWLVVFSDFLVAQADVGAVLERTALRAMPVLLVQVVDPAEADFPFHGRVRFEGVEGEAAQEFGRSESVAAAYRRKFQCHVSALQEMAAKQGAQWLSHRTDEDPQAALLQMVRELERKL